jgi:hypothetical protein
VDGATTDVHEQQLQQGLSETFFAALLGVPPPPPPDASARPCKSLLTAIVFGMRRKLRLRMTLTSCERQQHQQHQVRPKTRSFSDM